jgi:hypothetical protein
MAKEQSGFDVALRAVNKALGDEDADTDDVEVTDDDEVDDTADESDDSVDEESDEGDEESDDEAEGDETPEGEETPDTDDEAEEGQDDDAEETPEGDESDAEDVAKAEAAAKAVTTDEFDKLLDELGFRAPKKGQKVNRMPLDRVRARMKTALKKYAATRDTGVADLNGKITAHQARIDEMDRVEALIASSDTDPANARKYVELLAGFHPAFKAFLAEPQAPPLSADAEVQAAIKKLGAKPGPDVDYKDGTFGYSPEQMEKREQWLSDVAEIRAEARAVKRFEARLTPIEQERKTAEQQAKDAPRIAAQLDARRKMWGPHFLADEKKGHEGSEILAYQRTHKCSFDEATAAVILPKLIADRTKMRQDILAEFSRKRKKVAKTAPQATRRSSGKTGPQTNTDVVHAKLKKLGL